MPRGKKTRNQLGLPPLNVPGPAHWQDDFRSMLNSVMNQLLGRPSTREDTVFEIQLMADEAILNCRTVTPPRRVSVSIDEHLSSWTPPESKDPDAVMPEISELLVLLEADFRLPSAASADRQHQKKLAAAAAAVAATPEEAAAVAAVEIRASDEARMERRLTVQNSLRKSFEKRLSRTLLEELVSDGVLVINPEAINVSNAFTLGPCFVAPPQSERAFPKPAQLAEMLAAPGGRAQLTEMLAALPSHGSKQRNDMTAALGAAALGSRPMGGLQLKPPQAQHALLMQAGRDLLADFGAGGPMSPASPFAPPSGPRFVLPGALKRPGPPQMALPGQPSAHETLEAWCEERGAALEGGVRMAPTSPYVAGASWTATFKLPACQATGFEELMATVSAITRADAREQAAAHLLEQAKLRNFVCLPPPARKRSRTAIQS